MRSDYLRERHNTIDFDKICIRFNRAHELDVFTSFQHHESELPPG